MTEIEIALARALKFFFVRALVTWWMSLDIGTKGEIELTIAVILMMVLYVYLLLKLPKHLDTLSTQELKPFPTKREIPGVQPRKLNKIQSHWISIGVEIQSGVLLSVLFLLLAAFGSWPYNFYVLMRIVVCVSFALFAIVLHGQRMHEWETALGCWALLFNPIIPFHFARDTWQWLNVTAAITIALCAVFYAWSRLAAVKNVESPLNEPEVIDAMSTEPKILAKPAAYRYCHSCSIRVGRKAMFCKRCGAALS